MKRARYVVDTAKLTQTRRGREIPTPLNLALPKNFVQLEEDECTRQFLRENKRRLSPTKDSLATMLRSFGYSLTDANAIVDRGRLFVFGDSHIETLFGGAKPRGRLLLDVGAGCGLITERFSPGFEKTVALEMSAPMVRRLKQKGFVASSDPNALFDPAIVGKGVYDLVMMLNVLDRADKPITMLNALRSCVKPDTGHILLAVVLPWCPFVENGNRQDEPSEKLPMRDGTCPDDASFERSVAIMAEVLTSMGFSIEAWSRLPYISEGDSKKDVYVLDDAIFLLRPNSSSSSSSRRARSASGSSETDKSTMEPDFEALNRTRGGAGTGVLNTVLTPFF